MKGAYIYIVPLLLLKLFQCREAGQSKVVPAQLQLIAPDTLPAGALLKIRLRQAHEARQQVYMLFSNAWATRIVALPAFSDTTILFNEESSGLLEVRVIAAGNLVQRKILYVMPEKAVTPLEAYLGSKSIIANGQDAAMLTGVPLDTFGNMMEKGTPINFTVLKPDKTLLQATRQVNAGIAWLKITAGIRAGKSFAGVNIGQAFSDEKELLEVAGFPINFSIHALAHTSFADGRQTFHVRTDSLADGYGNMLPDGTLVIFQCLHTNGARQRLNAYTIAGRAEVTIRNPAAPGTLSITAAVEGGGASNPLKIAFSGMLSALPVQYNPNASQLIIGPLRGPLKQLLPQGTAVILRNGPLILQTSLLQGVGVFSTDQMPKGRQQFLITVAGQSFTKELDIR